MISRDVKVLIYEQLHSWWTLFGFLIDCSSTPFVQYATSESILNSTMLQLSHRFHRARIQKMSLPETLRSERLRSAVRWQRPTATWFRQTMQWFYGGRKVDPGRHFFTFFPVVSLCFPLSHRSHRGVETTLESPKVQRSSLGACQNPTELQVRPAGMIWVCLKMGIPPIIAI